MRPYDRGVKKMSGQDIKPGWGGQFVRTLAELRYMEPASDRRNDRRCDPLFATQLILQIAQERSQEESWQRLVGRAAQGPHLACGRGRLPDIAGAQRRRGPARLLCPETVSSGSAFGAAETVTRSSI